ncbi:MAG: TonB-dependent receptor [Leptospiraceae bacterium]|nr:TonB-dependent receptor [Leptospiraceae bacterium]MCK6379793.1 TonB-dependent receptor [Leptospiraceae bacterium]
MRKSIISIVFVIASAFGIFSQEKPNKTNEKTICLSNFSNFESNSNLEIVKLIDSIITKSFSEKNFIIKKVNENSIQSKLHFSLKNNCYFFIDGYYKKLNNSENLQLYSQIYNPETSLMIDAFNIADEYTELGKLKLDPEESKESDELRVRNLAKRLRIVLLNNSKKIERRENIDEYVLSSKISENNKFPISSGKEAEEEAAKQVFNLLQNQVTTSSTKTQKRTNEAPNVISVISDKEIIDYGRNSINDILYQLPGFSPSQINERRTVSARGMHEGWNNNHILILQDGVQFNENFYGSALTWELTPLNMVKSVEVIRGPGSALYGSNAMYGVVSLNTYSGKDLNGEVRLRARMGDHGTRIYDIVTGNTTNLISYIVSMNSYDTTGNSIKGYDNSGRVDDLGFLQKFPYKDERNNYSLLLKLEGEGDLKGFSLQYNRQYWKYGTFNGWLQNTPDFKDQMSENRDIAVLKYSKNITDKLSHEYVIKYSPGEWKFNARLYPSDPNNYPSGVTENLNTRLDNYFGRGQVTYHFDNKGSIVAGVEANQISYRGDKEHSSNVDMNLLGTGEPFSGNIVRPLEPYMDWITDRPIKKIATFGQFSSGKIFEKRLEITLGTRYDESSMHFRGIDMPYNGLLGYPTYNYTDPVTGLETSNIVPSRFLAPPFVTNEKKVYRKTSPRIGLVFFATDRLTFKLLAGRAFREPSPGELFGVNTYVGGSNNPRKISPEIIKTYEGALDWYANKYINLRLNAFATRTENMIDYSDTSNTIINAYTLGTKGLESELLFTYKNVSAFANYSKFTRYLDHNLKASESKHQSEITGSPASLANFGITGSFKIFSGSISVQRQGVVTRKRSDLGSIEPITGTLTENTYSDPYRYPVYRPIRVEAWTNVNLRFEVKLMENLRLGVFASNALNRPQYLTQTGNFPTDYLRETRRVLIDLRANF